MAMKLYQNGDRCPCCGNVIEGKTDEWLELFSVTVALLEEDGLLPELSEK